jgi:hypothetical protein
MKDKDVIAGWLRLYNVLNKAAFVVVKNPDQQNRKAKDIDALCEDGFGNRLAIEHTLIQPFEGEKGDRSRFLQTFATLVNDPRLVLPGFEITASLAAGFIPAGVQLSGLSTLLCKDLERILPGLPDGPSEVNIGPCSIPLTVSKDRLSPGEQPSFTVMRVRPHHPSQGLMLKALKEKIPKLARYTNATRILLWEKDAIAGPPESQFAGLSATAEMETLLRQIDAIWTVNTCHTESESVVYTNDVWPTLRKTVCSLNLKTGKFWQAHR